MPAAARRAAAEPATPACRRLRRDTADGPTERRSSCCSGMSHKLQPQRPDCKLSCDIIGPMVVLPRLLLALLSSLPCSRPRHLGRQRHQYRLDIAAGLETEERAAVVEQVEL